MGSVNVSMKHPQFYIEPIRRWFNKLSWYPRDQGPNSPEKTVTLLECVVGFELSTGLCLGSMTGKTLTWTQKALRLFYYLKAIIRTHSVRWTAIQVSLKQALRPTTDATSITPRGGPLMAGFARKPKWVDARTPKIAAVNIWKARQQRTEGQGSLPALGTSTCKATGPNT